MKRTLALPFALLPVLAFVHCNPASTGGDGGGSDGGGDSAPVNTCAKPTGSGTKHSGTITADETWKAADSPHILTFGVKVAKGATLTIEPCAEVRIQKTYSIVAEGNLVAEGTASNPITIGADDPSTPWGFLQAFAPGTIKLAYATVSDGGGESTNAYGMIEARGDQYAPAQEILKLDHVTLSGSQDYGVSLREGGAFTADSQAVTITKCKKTPMRIWPRLATNVPTGTYTGNAADAIVVETASYSEVNNEDVTFHDRGVPYVIGFEQSLGQLVVGPKHYKLTIEPGVIFAFKKDGFLRAKDDGVSTGVISAIGTAQKPIVFTSLSDTPAAGDWIGIQLGTVPDPQFKFDYVSISYAGAFSGATGYHCFMGQQWKDDAALAIFHEPPASIITNSEITDSKGDGVDNAYKGSFVDERPTNTFKNINGCDVTQPQPKMGVCPNMNCP